MSLFRSAGVLLGFVLTVGTDLGNLAASYAELGKEANDKIATLQVQLGQAKKAHFADEQKIARLTAANKLLEGTLTGVEQRLTKLAEPPPAPPAPAPVSSLQTFVTAPAAAPLEPSDSDNMLPGVQWPFGMY